MAYYRDEYNKQLMKIMLEGEKGNGRTDNG